MKFVLAALLSMSFSAQAYYDIYCYVDGENSELNEINLYNREGSIGGFFYFRTPDWQQWTQNFNATFSEGVERSDLDVSQDQIAWSGTYQTSLGYTLYDFELKKSPWKVTFVEKDGQVSKCVAY